MVRLYVSETALKMNTVLIIARRLIDDGNSRNKIPTIELATSSCVPWKGALNISLPIMSHKYTAQSRSPQKAETVLSISVDQTTKSFVSPISSLVWTVITPP